ncbi:unnamed protein product [Aphanomyces euteiches]
MASLAFLTYGLTAISLCFFTGVFWLSWVLSLKYVPIFRTYTRTEQANWCSRIGSTLHATVICFGMLYSLSVQSWDSNLHPLHSVDLARAFFSWSIAYFIYDLVVVVTWKVPLWQVFTVHHFVAMLPFAIFNFYRGNCSADTYLLSVYLLVELCVLPMNAAAFLEDLGYGDTKLHLIVSYFMYGSWVIVRGLLPIYALYVLWAILIPSLDFHVTETWICAGPAIVCGNLISCFCVGCLIFVITPAFMTRLRQKPGSSMDDLHDNTSLVAIRRVSTYGTITLNTP